MKVGSAQKLAPGEEVCGDDHLVVSEPVCLLALADGLGHGPAAHTAARAFCGFVAKNAENDLEKMLLEASRAVAKTRGAAAALLHVDQREERISFAGVGNIGVQTVGHPEMRPICVPGIVGSRVRKVLRFDYDVVRGMRVAMFTDGVSSRFELEGYSKLDAQQAADEIVRENAKGHDDATCLVLDL
jgi:serine/threonine protein phosphatase PrpC